MLQDKQLIPPKERSRKSKWWKVAKLITTLLIVSYLYSVINRENKGVEEIYSVLTSVFRSDNGLKLLLIGALVPLNWMLEAWKWKLLAQKAVLISYREALKSTLIGLAVGLAVPAQLGDTIGRIASLHAKNRLRTLGAALISNGIQFYVSIVGGAVSWYIASPSLALSSEIRLAISSFLIAILLAGLLVGVFRFELVNWKSKRGWAIKLKKNVQVVKHYSGKELGTALLVGQVRYLVFVLQFTLALSLFQFSIPTTTLAACVGLILLTKTILPVVNVIGDLGVREFTALYVFEPYQLSSEKVVAATFLIWLINIMGPVLVGLVLIWKNKLSTKYV